MLLSARFQVVLLKMLFLDSAPNRSHLIALLRLCLLNASWGAATLAVILGDISRPLTNIGVVAFALFVLMTLPQLRRDSLIILGMLGIISLFLFDGLPNKGALLQGGASVLIFAALLPTMALVRATATTMPSVQQTQRQLTQLPAKESAGGLQIAGHVFGGIINTGAFAMLSAALPRNSSQAQRQIAAEAAIRGMVSSAAWSPFFVAFAIGQNFVEPIYAWGAIGIGIATAILFSLVTLFGLNRQFTFRQLVASLLCLRPVAIRLSVVLIMVLGVALLFDLTALSAVVTAMPMLVLMQMARYPQKVKTILAETRSAMDQIGDDVVIITSAMFVAYFAMQSAAMQQFVNAVYPGDIPGWFALIATPVLMMVASVVGIHPVITSSALLTVFGGGGADVHPALLVQSHLIGWGAGTMSSVASLSVISCASLYRVPARRLALGPNLIVGFVYALLGGCLLSALEVFL